MKTCHFLLAAAILLLTPPALRAEENPALGAVRAADDARVAATIAADPVKLGAVFSDELRYAHSSGAVDSKASLTEALVTGRTKYLHLDYETREFTFPAPSIALMTGRVHAQVASASGSIDTILGYLAVWRLEAGQWRFLAWQSCRLPSAAPAK